MTMKPSEMLMVAGLVLFLGFMIFKVHQCIWKGRCDSACIEYGRGDFSC